jgi:hypothetical protein
MDAKTKALKSFANCSALYAAYCRTELRAKRAQLHGDKVVAEPLDYTCDFCLKTKRALGNSLEYPMVLRLCEAGTPLSIPESTRQRVGQMFLDYKLEEAYSPLFARAMQNKSKAGAEDYRLLPQKPSVAAQLDSLFSTPEPDSTLNYFGESQQ